MCCGQLKFKYKHDYNNWSKFLLSQSKLAYERLPVQKVYHPFVCGPNNVTIKTLMDETGVKINVPPLSVMSDEIVVSGEKEGVMKCKATIMSIYEEKVNLFKAVISF